MTAVPDMVVLTGDLTETGAASEWAELTDRIESLAVPWHAIAGNHDQAVAELAGHRCVAAGPLRLVLLDTSSEEFTPDDAAWLTSQLEMSDQPTVVAMHHPPFETGIWWMDCAGMSGSERFEHVVRSHPCVIKVICGHVHRVIQTQWDGCSLWTSPSTANAVAVDFDPAHGPAETAEPPAFSLHAYTGSSIVSHVVPVGASATRTLIEANAPEFVSWARSKNETRPTQFG